MTKTMSQAADTAADLIKQTAPEQQPMQTIDASGKSVHPGSMISVMLEHHKDIDVVQMTALFELQKAYDDDMARKAYHAAKAHFTSICPAITRDQDVSFNDVAFSFTSLAGALELVRPALTKCGLTPSWRIGEDNDRVRVTCVLTHDLGYEEQTSLSVHRDAGKGGKMNSIQSLKSTISYLERITFFALLGLASAYDDDDGQGAGDPVDEKKPSREDPPALPVMSDEFFNSNKQAYYERITAGMGTPAALINRLQTKYTLTTEQLQAINDMGGKTIENS